MGSDAQLEALVREIASEIAEHYGFDLDHLRRVATSRSSAEAFRQARGVIAIVAHALLRNEWARDGERASWERLDALCFHVGGRGELPPLGPPVLADVARIFGCSERTLERCLRRAGLDPERAIIGAIRPTPEAPESPIPEHLLPLRRQFERYWSWQRYRRTDGRQRLR